MSPINLAALGAFTKCPEDVISSAMAQPGYRPVIRTICLTSGGGDSTVLAHRCRDLYDELVHLDTGTALPGVRDFVMDFGLLVGKPVRVGEAGDAYREIILGADEWWPIYHHLRRRKNSAGGVYGQSKFRTGDYETPDEFRDRCGKLATRELRMELLYHRAPLGFPGPANHAKAYQRLKERPLEAVLRDIKSEYGVRAQKQRVVLLSGVRTDESGRRKMTGTARGGWERRGNQIWVNPIIDWTNEDMRSYRAAHRLPISDVTAMTHRSGECNCLAFAAKGEREFVISVYPTWYAQKIKSLEDEAKARGLKYWQWGWGAGPILQPVEKAGLMCQDCVLATAA